MLREALLLCQIIQDVARAISSCADVGARGPIWTGTLVCVCVQEGFNLLPSCVVLMQISLCDGHLWFGPNTPSTLEVISDALQLDLAS